MRSSSRSAKTCAVAGNCAASGTGGSTGDVMGRPTALLERGTDAGEHALVLHVRHFLAAHLGERAHELVFFGREAGGHLDVDAHEQVTPPAPAQRVHTATLEPEDVTRLRTRSDDELLDSLERLDVEVRAEGRLRERDRAHVQ